MTWAEFWRHRSAAIAARGNRIVHVSIKCSFRFKQLQGLHPDMRATTNTHNLCAHLCLYTRMQAHTNNKRLPWNLIAVRDEQPQSTASPASFAFMTTCPGDRKLQKSNFQQLLTTYRKSRTKSLILSLSIFYNKRNRRKKKSINGLNSKWIMSIVSRNPQACNCVHRRHGVFFSPT